MEKRIDLYRTPAGWQARQFGADATECQRLFGTDTLPTAYTARADSAKVGAAIQALNPGYEINILEPVVPWGDR